MNLSKISALCKASDTYNLYEDPEGNQWLGTEDAMYPVSGIQISAVGIPALFGLTEKQQEAAEIHDENAPWLNTAMSQKEMDETPYKLFAGKLTFGRTVYRILLREETQEYMLLEERNLRPLGKDMDEVAFCPRPPFVVCARNLLVDAYVRPAPEEVVAPLVRRFGELFGKWMARLPPEEGAEKA